MSYSPVKNIDYSKITTSGPDKGYIDPANQSPAENSGTKGAQGAAIAGQVAGVASSLIDTSDPLSKDAVAKSAAAKGLEYAAMGSALGPWGAVAGLAVGSVVGAVEGNKAKKQAIRQIKIDKGFDNLASVNKRRREMQSYDYSNINADGTMGVTMRGPLKMLTGVNSPMTYKMSAAQYKSAVKMSEISGASTLPSPMTKMADKDYDGDGKVESSKEEYFGSRDKAIKENKN